MKMQKGITPALITIVAIITIAILTTMAIINHIDGYILALAIGAISGLGGYSVAWKRYRK